MKYFVRRGSTTHEVILDGETVTFDGTSLRAHLETIEGTPVQLVAIGEQVHRVLVRRGAERGSYDLSIDGHRVAVEALDERARTIRDMSGATGRPIGPAHLTAPMPGMIVRLNVKEGDQVRAGQGLVVMEAMKMENELRAAASGTVLRILVSPGNAVEKGAILLEMEA
jgi:acetyl/propionyl-CoA carboxylase alpha subunit